MDVTTCGCRDCGVHRKVSEEVALFYIYTFMYAGKEVHFYAAEEGDARKQFSEAFGVQAGELLRRTNW